MNEYKSLYLRDVLATIDRVAIDSMMCPRMDAENDVSLEEVNAYNCMIAHNNEGIRDFVGQLRNALMEDENNG